MPVSNVTADSPATSAWANSVADSVADIEATPASVVATGIPGSSAVGDTANAGTATNLARRDHRHAREAFANPGSSAVGDSVSGGAAASVARSDHRHGREGFGAVSTEVDASLGGIPGSALTVAHSDHRHGFTPNLLLPGTIITASLATDQNNWAPTGLAGASLISITITAVGVAISGIQGGVDGRMLYLVLAQASSNSFTLQIEDSASTAANRIVMFGASGFTVDRGALLIYYGSRWHVVSGN